MEVICLTNLNFYRYNSQTDQKHSFYNENETLFGKLAVVL